MLTAHIRAHIPSHSLTSDLHCGLYPRCVPCLQLYCVCSQHTASLRSASMHASIPCDALVQQAPPFVQRRHCSFAKRTCHKCLFSSSGRPQHKALALSVASSSVGQPAPERPEDEVKASRFTQPQNVPLNNTVTPSAKPASLGQRIKQIFGGDKLDRKRLQALGLGAVASYGFVSNATYGTGLSISWITFVRQTGAKQ